MTESQRFMLPDEFHRRLKRITAEIINHLVAMLQAQNKDNPLETFRRVYRTDNMLNQRLPLSSLRLRGDRGGCQQNLRHIVRVGTPSRPFPSTSNYCNHSLSWVQISQSVHQFQSTESVGRDSYLDTQMSIYQNRLN